MLASNSEPRAHRILSILAWEDVRHRVEIGLKYSSTLSEGQKGLKLLAPGLYTTSHVSHHDMMDEVFPRCLSLVANHDVHRVMDEIP